MKDPMNMHTWLDSAQPRGDWSNPLPTNNGKAQNPAPAERRLRLEEDCEPMISVCLKTTTQIIL